MNTTQPTSSNAVATAAGRGRTRRITIAICLMAALALVGVSCTKNAAAQDSLNRINDARGALGLQPLSLDDTLVNKAQAWANHMAAAGTVSHSVLTDGAGSNWSVLGENVGWARSIAEMQSMFMNSAAHRANILSARFNRVGTGVAEVNGQFYVVQVFAG